MDRSGDAYLCARLDQRDARQEHEKNQFLAGHMGEAVEPCIVYLVFRLSFSFPVFVISGKLAADERKSSCLFVSFETNSFYERWTRSSRSTMLPLGQSQRGRSLFLSFSLPAFHRLFSSVALRLVPMRLLFPLVFTLSLSHGTCTPARSLLLGPRCCQIVRESHGQKTFAMLHSRELRSSVSSGSVAFLHFFAHANLVDSIFFIYKSIKNHTSRLEK